MSHAGSRPTGSREHTGQEIKTLYVSVLFIDMQILGYSYYYQSSASLELLICVAFKRASAVAMLRRTTRETE